MVQFLSNGTAKTKLVILAFLYCGEFVKNPIVLTLIGTQIEMVNKSATVRLPRKKIVGPFRSLDFIIDNIITLFPEKKLQNN